MNMTTKYLGRLNNLTAGQRQKKKEKKVSGFGVRNIYIIFNLCYYKTATKYDSQKASTGLPISQFNVFQIPEHTLHSPVNKMITLPSEFCCNFFPIQIMLNVLALNYINSAKFMKKLNMS